MFKFFRYFSHGQTGILGLWDEALRGTVKVSVADIGGIDDRELALEKDNATCVHCEVILARATSSIIRENH